MNDTRMAGAIAGGLVAGLGITALLIAGERKSGQPSETVTLEHKTAAMLGLETPAAGVLPSVSEQAISQGGHLLLSAAAGAVYAATVDEDASVLGSGLMFGAAFYAAMHWITGPLLGVKPPEWRADASTIGMHTANHLVFSLVTALGAKFGQSKGNGPR